MVTLSRMDLELWGYGVSGRHVDFIVDIALSKLMHMGFAWVVCLRFSSSSAS